MKSLRYRLGSAACITALAAAIAAGPAIAAPSHGSSHGKHSAKASAHSSNIVQYAARSKSLTTLVAAVKAADLAGTLSGKGPFTVFAPTDAAFAKLPEGTVASLLEPGNKGKLADILTYHVVPSKVLSSAVAKLIADGGGEASITTVAGGKIVARLSGKTITLSDEKGGIAAVTTADLQRSNGVIHVIDTVLLPKG